MEIETEDTCSTYTETEDVSQDNFTKEINSIKSKMYSDQLISLFTTYNIDQNKIEKLLINLKTIYNENNNLLTISKFIEFVYKIKIDIISNNFENAISEIKNNYRNTLSGNKIILFMLHKQILLNLVKSNKIDESLNYAKKNLMPLALNNEGLYKEMGEVIFLLSFKNLNKYPDKEFISNDENKLSEIANKIVNMILLYFIGDNIKDNIILK